MDFLDIQDKFLYFRRFKDTLQISGYSGQVRGLQDFKPKNYVYCRQQVVHFVSRQKHRNVEKRATTNKTNVKLDAEVVDGNLQSTSDRVDSANTVEHDVYRRL